jgi:hypothetical protein
VKPNGHVPHPPVALSPRLPKGPPFNARVADRRLLAAMRDNPGLSVAALANAAGSSRTAIGERLRRLAAQGAIEKDPAGRWRLKAEETEARPMLASPS